MPDYLPRIDSDLSIWLANFSSQLSSSGATYDFAPAEVTALTGGITTFKTALEGWQNMQAIYSQTRQDKDTARHISIEQVRAAVGRLQKHPAMTDAIRALYGITISDGIRTPTSAAVVDGHRPVGIVDTSQRLRHEISFYDEATPQSRARPRGVMGCEIYVKIGGAPPVDISECAFLALDTASPYVAEYTGADAGKTAYYILRWATLRGDKGPVSETIAATIGA